MTKMASWEQKNGCASNKGFISSEEVVQKVGLVLGYYYKLQFICNTPSFLERSEGFRRIQNGPKGFQKLFSLPFSVAFVELLLCF
jgi:hypothetical protein